MEYGYSEVPTNIFVNGTNESDNSSSIPRKCEFGIPSSSNLLGHVLVWKGEDVALFVICSLSFILCLVVSLDTLIYTVKARQSSARKALTLWMVSTYPVFVILSMLAVLIPRGATTCDFVGSMYYAIIQYKFTNLILDYMGGEDVTCDKLGDTSQMKMMAGPCCCCCCCLPNVRFTRRNLLVIKLSILQSPLIHVIVLIMAILLWNDGSHVPAGFAVENAQFWFVLFTSGSKLLGLYTLNILLTGVRFSLDGFKPMGKFAIFPIMLCCTRVQSFIIGMVAMTGRIPCAAPFSPAGRAIVLHNSLLAFEVFLLSIWGRWLYKTELPITTDDSSDYTSEEGHVKLTKVETEVEFLEKITVA